MRWWWGFSRWSFIGTGTGFGVRCLGGFLFFGFVFSCVGITDGFVELELVYFVFCGLLFFLEFFGLLFGFSKI